jgi:hypothetical protein
MKNENESHSHTGRASERTAKSQSKRILRTRAGLGDSAFV